MSHVSETYEQFQEKEYNDFMLWLAPGDKLKSLTPNMIRKEVEQLHDSPVAFVQQEKQFSNQLREQVQGQVAKGLSQFGQVKIASAKPEVSPEAQAEVERELDLGLSSGGGSDFIPHPMHANRTGLPPTYADWVYNTLSDGLKKEAEFNESKEPLNSDQRLENRNRLQLAFNLMKKLAPKLDSLKIKMENEPKPELQQRYRNAYTAVARPSPF